MARVKARVYFNTSLLIRAVNPRERNHKRALAFIEDLRSRDYVVVTSSLLLYEGLKHPTLKAIKQLLHKHAFILIRVDEKRYLRKAEKWVIKHGYSYSRILDVAHMMIARNHHCKYIAALDRFIWRHAREFNLTYINYYTGVPRK